MGSGRWVGRLHPAVAGAVAGLVAGVVYLVTQLALSALAPETDTFAPLYRKAAMLMGGETAGGTTTSGAFGIALLIHFTLAAAFGRLIERAVRARAPLLAAVIGAAVGVLLYAVNFHVIAPSAFPWFADAAGAITAVTHALFGAVAGVLSVVLARADTEAAAAARP